MKPKTFSILASVFVLAALLMTSGSGVVAQGPLPPQGLHPQSPEGTGYVEPVAPQSPEAVAANVNADGIFTYQGQLKFNGNPYDGACDFSLGIYDAASGGSLVGGPYTALNTAVSKGLFSAPINYQNWGPQRWIQIGVSCPHSASPSYQALSPRQKITAAPYANSLRPGAETRYVDSSGNGISEAYIAYGSTAGLYGIGYYTGTAGVYGYTGANVNTPGVKGVSARPGNGFHNFGVVGLASKGTYNGITIDYDAGGAFSGPNGMIGVASPDTDNGWGVYGVTTGTYGVGVRGWAGATTGTNYGVYGVSASSSGIGVGGQAISSTGITYGVYGTSNSSSGTGVYGTAPYTGVVGRASSSTGTTYGVYGQSGSSGGYGVLGTAPTYGVRGNATSTGGTSYGVWGDSDSLNNTAAGGSFVAGTTATTSQSDGVVGRANGQNTSAYGVAGWAYYNGAGVGAWSYSGNIIEGYAGDYPGGTRQMYLTQAGYLYVNGGYGTFAKTSKDESGAEYRALTAIQSSEAWYEDFGKATLVNGKVVVKIEPLFAKTVNMGVDYHVYVTPLCSEAVVLFVSDKSAQGFTVQGVTLDGKPSQCAFDYRIVAKPVGQEDTRLPAVGGPVQANDPAAAPHPAKSEPPSSEPSLPEPPPAPPAHP
jgi:hypothetical protein